MVSFRIAILPLDLRFLDCFLSSDIVYKYKRIYKSLVIICCPLVHRHVTLWNKRGHLLRLNHNHVFRCRHYWAWARGRRTVVIIVTLVIMHCVTSGQTSYLSPGQCPIPFESWSTVDYSKGLLICYVTYGSKT